MGFLAGKYRKDGIGWKGEGRLRTLESDPRIRTFTDRNWRILDTLLSVAQQLGKEPARVALNWVSSQQGITSPIVGATSVVQLSESLAALEFGKADRGGRIFIDTGRNRPGATFAAAYTVRPKPGAPVSAPCTWKEIERGDVGPQSFTLRTMASRIAEVGDLWREMESDGRSLRGPMTALERLLTEEDWKEALAATTRRPASRKPRPK
jgi:hypothetical protein